MKEYKMDLSMYEGKVREAVSEAVQKKAFELGYQWSSSGKTIMLTGKPYLYFDKYGEITFTNDSSVGYFESRSGIQISANDFLALTTAKDEPKFKPFDRVLVRDKENQNWRASYFSHVQGGSFACVVSFWRQCIPYEGNEHLVGTTDDPKQ